MGDVEKFAPPPVASSNDDWSSQASCDDSASADDDMSDDEDDNLDVFGNNSFLPLSFCDSDDDDEAGEKEIDIGGMIAFYRIDD